MIPSLEGWPTKAKEAPSPHQVRLTPLDNDPVLLCLGDNFGEDSLILLPKSHNNSSENSTNFFFTRTTCEVAINTILVVVTFFMQLLPCFPLNFHHICSNICDENQLLSKEIALMIKQSESFLRRLYPKSLFFMHFQITDDINR